MKYDEILTINGSALTKHYIQSLNKQERENLIEPIFQEFRKIGFLYPDDSIAKLKKDYQRLIDYQPDVDTNELFNNSSLATNVCRYFCRSFFNATDTKAPTMMELFNNDEKLRKTIRNRLGLDWLESDGKGPGVNESFNLSFRMLIQGFRSQRLTATISMFKPNIAKYLCTKYSNVGDTVGDYSCGFGGRLLGAMSCQRKYIGTDPLTTEELEVMAKFYNFKDYTLIKSGSENYRGDPNSVDLYYSSPPYYADAYNNPDINSFTIALKGSDKSHLIKLAKLLSYPPDKIIDGYAELNDKLFPTSSLKLYSKHLCQTMTKLGCMKAKSFIIKYPTWLKEDLHLHFIRGMFDGDGCLTKRKQNNEWKWSLVSTKEACQDIKNIIEKHLNMIVNFECISKTNNNSYCLEVTGNERIHKMMTWLYLDSHETIRLDRKYQKHLELIDQQNNRRFSRKQYKVPDGVKLEILNKIKSGRAIVDVAKEYQLHPRTISKMKKKA